MAKKICETGMRTCRLRQEKRDMDKEHWLIQISDAIFCVMLFITIIILIDLVL